MLTEKAIKQADQRISIVEVDKIGSSTINLTLAKMVGISPDLQTTVPGDCVIVRALTDNANYNQLELTTGRLAKINPGDVIAGVLGRRRALKGFIGDSPAKVAAGDRLHILNLGGVIGVSSGACRGLGSAIEVEVLGVAVNEDGSPLNIGRAPNAIQPRNNLSESTAPIVIIATTTLHGQVFPDICGSGTGETIHSTRPACRGSEIIRRCLPARHPEYARPRRGRDGQFCRMRTSFNRWH